MQLFMIACSWTAVWKSSLPAAVLLAALQLCEFSHQEGSWNSLTQALTAVRSGPLILLSHILSHDLAIKVLSCWPKYKLGNKQSQCKVLLCCTNCLALGARWIVLLSSIESVSLVQIHLCCKKKKSISRLAEQRDRCSLGVIAQRSITWEKEVLFVIGHWGKRERGCRLYSRSFPQRLQPQIHSWYPLWDGG